MRRFALVLFGVALALGLIEGSLRLASLSVRRASRPPAPRARPAGTLRILCLGESTTAKTLPEDFSWPTQLEAILRARLKTDVEVVNVGLRSAHTGYLLGQLPRQLADYRPDLVVAMAGINDDYWFAVAGAEADRGWRLSKVLRWAYHSLTDPPPPTKIRSAERWKKSAMDVEPPESRLAPCWRRLEARDLDGAYACARASARAGTRAPKLYGETALLLLEGRAPRKKEAAGLLAGVSALKLVHPRLLEAEAALARAEGRPEDEQRLLRRAIELTPVGGWIYADLITSLRRRKQYAAARTVFGMFRAAGPHDARPLVAMQDLCVETGDDACVAALADELLSLLGRPVAGVLTDKPKTDTVGNLRRMVDLTRAAGATFVAMQYPRLDPRQVEVIHAGQDVPVVSNVDNFEGALARGRYDDYFVDRFRGYWGHATREGNRLIAERLASELTERGLLTPRR